MAKSGVLTVKVVGDASRFNKTIDGVTGKLSGVGSKIAKVGKVAALGTAAAAGGAFALGQEVLNTGAKLTAWRQKTATVFEGSAADIRKWADDNNETFGVTDDQLSGLAASFGDLLKPMGFTADQAASMSMEVVGLSGALSEWSGGQRSAAEVSEILAKAMLGEREGLKELGISITEAEVQGRLLEKGQEGLTGAALQQAKALATQELVFEKSTDAQKAYAEGGNEALRATNRIKAGIGELREQMADKLLPIALKVADWLGKQVPKAMEALAPAAEAIGDAFSKVAGVLSEFWYTLTSGFTQDEGTQVEGWALTVRDAFFRLSDFVQTKLMPAFSSIAGFIKDNLKPILVGLGVAVALITAPFTSVVAAVVLAYTRFEGFRNVVDAVAAFLVDTVWPKIQQFAQFINEQFNALVGWVRANWDSIQEAITHVVNAIEAYITLWINTLSALWRAWGDDLLNMAETIWNYIRETIENVIKIIQGVIQTVLALINGDWGEAWEGIKQIAAGIWDQIHNIISTAINLVKSTLGGVLSTIAEVWSGVWDGIKGTLSDIWQGIQWVVAAGIDAVVGFVKGLPGKVSDAAAGAFDGLSGAAKSAFNAIIRFWNNTAGKISFKAPGWVPGVGGKGFSMPTFAELHDGGIIGPNGIIPLRRDERFAKLQVGETVLPKNADRNAGRSMGPASNVTIDVGGITVVSHSQDPAAVAREVRRELLRVGQRNGTVGLA